VSSILLTRTVESRSPFLESVSGHSGRINLGLNGLAHYMAFYPFLNAWKSGAPIHLISDGIAYSSHNPPGCSNSAWGRFLDNDGELVRPLPANITQMERIFYSSPQDGLPDGFNRIGAPWILKWEGTANRVTVLPASSQVRAGNRIEWVWDINEGDHRVVF